MRKSWTPALAVLALLAALVAACGDDSAGPSGTLRANWSGLPASWEPGTSIASGYLRVPYETLVELASDGSGKAQPRLATKWEQTNTALTLTLREGVTFHDGTRFDAQAVKTNIEFVRDGNGQFAGPLKVIESIVVLNPHEVRLNLSRPTPSLLSVLGGLGVPMASPKALADGTLRERPVGTGPWRFAEPRSVKGTKLRFTSYPQYYDPESVNFRAIELFGITDVTASLNAIRTGQLDIGNAEPSQLSEADTDIEAVRFREGYNPLILFFDIGPGGTFEDVNVRRAVCSAVNTAEIAKAAPPGQVTRIQQRFGEGEFGHNPTIEGYPPDLAAARRFLAAAGNPSITASVASFAQTAPNNQVIAAQLQEIGIELKLVNLTFSEFLSTWNTGKYEIGDSFLFETHPESLYSNNFAENAPGNPAQVESTKLKQAAQAAFAAGTSSEASELWGDVMKVLIDDDVRLCGQVVINAGPGYNTDRVTNVHGIAFEASGVDYRALRLKEE